MNFADLGLSQPVLRGLADCGYTTPTPIQSESIPIVQAGHDLIACAQTGTGKTAAFMLPIIDDIAGRDSAEGDMPLALVLTPTRELAQQIDENIQAYGKYVGTRTCVVVGGVSSGRQIDRLRKGADIVIATPGRLIDLMEQGEMIMDDIDFLILDEADRMLDMGFIHDVRWIAEQVPTPRQTLLFSATISPGVRSLASSMQTEPKSVSVAPPATVADNIDQQVMFVEKADKIQLLTELLKNKETDRALVFTATKNAATRVARQLEQKGVSADAIHSNKTQSQRMKSLENFTKGKVQVLVATDIVARGIDVEGISHVINYDLPKDAENYVHRIGRTARAGKAGIAVSLCGVEDVSSLRGVQRMVKEPLSVQDDHQWHSPMVAACLTASALKTKTRSRGPRFG
jgi:ATP-dependent RNA helicase RhlE|nr:DEAD/DEAH box helicase [Candidatus Krumholzibacteria bacterium]